MKVNRLLAGFVSITVIMQGICILPVSAEENKVTYADIVQTAGNDEMKMYGTNVEAGDVKPQVKNDTVPSGSGTTYYVDADSGNDDNDGTSEENAWQSVEKVNTVTYQPGDRILFKAGCTWTAPTPTGDFYDNDKDGLPETFLAPQGSGTKEEWIVIGAYGEGELPKLVGEANVNSVISLKDQEYWDISNLDVSNQHPDFNPSSANDSNNAKTMGNLRAIQIYGQSHSDDGITPGGTLDGFKLHDLYVHDVSGHVYWGGSPLDRGYPGVFGNMGNDASKRTGGIVFEIWEPTTENDLTEEKLENTKDRPITFNNIIISNNVICNTSFGGITIKQWSGQGHDEVNLNGFHSDAVAATNELWHRRFAETSKPDGYTGEMGTAENGYTNAGFHPHTNVYITDNYVSNSKTEYGCNTIRLQSVQGGLVEHNICSGAGTCAIELDYLDDVVVQYNEVYGTRKKMGGADNNAIDTDSETTNCLIQYNYVYNNGDGFLLCGIGFSTAVYRYNVIRDSGEGDHYIGLYGDEGWNYIHNNLIYSTNNATSFVGRPGDKNVDKASNPIYYYNNIFCNASSGGTTPALYQGTYSYYSNNSYWGNMSVPSSDKNAVMENPNFTGDFIDDLKAFEITEFSPLIDSGKNVEYPNDFGGTFVDKYMYNLDFYGNDVNIADKPDIGVSEFQFTDGKGIINGYVTDEYGNPASGAAVSFGEDQFVITNENGYYSTGELTAGDYILTVSKDNYADSEPLTMSVTEKNVTNVDLSLGESQLDTGLIRGVVTGDGKAIEGATVVLALDENTYETITNANGEYTIEAAAAEDYTIAVTKEGYKYKSQTNVSIQKGNITELDFVLQSNDYSNTVYFINDSFNDYETGDFTANDIWSVYGESNGKIEIVEEDDGNKYLHINKTNKSSSDIGVFNTNAANLSGTITIEARIMRTTHGSGSYNQFGMYTFNSADWKGGGSSTNPIATFFMLDKSISTHYKNESGGNSVYELKPYEFNEWHTVRCVANLETKTYDFYVDDMITPIISNYKLRNASQSVIDRFLFYSNGINTGDICVDYFRVCTGSAYDYNDTALSSVLVDGKQAEKLSDTQYSVTVSHDTEKVQILPVTQSAFALAKVGSQSVSDEAVEITLDEGDNEIKITVIAEDGTEKEYSLNIHKVTEAEEKDAELENIIVNGIEAEKISDTEYSVEVPNGTTELNIIPNAFDSYYAVVQVNGVMVDKNGADLEMTDDEIKVTVTVISKIGVTKSYTLTITRAQEQRDFEIISNGISNGNLSVNIINNLESSKNAAVILAVYDCGNKLMYVNSQSKTISSEIDNIIEFQDIVFEDGCTARIMLWDSLNNMIPLCEVKSVQ